MPRVKTKTRVEGTRASNRDTIESRTCRRKRLDGTRAEESRARAHVPQSRLRASRASRALIARHQQRLRLRAVRACGAVARRNVPRVCTPTIELIDLLLREKEGGMEGEDARARGAVRSQARCCLSAMPRALDQTIGTKRLHKCRDGPLQRKSETWCDTDRWAKLSQITALLCSLIVGPKLSPHLKLSISQDPVGSR